MVRGCRHHGVTHDGAALCALMTHRHAVFSRLVVVSIAILRCRCVQRKLKTDDWRFASPTPGSQVCVEGPKEKLDSTMVSQPAIYVSSLAAVEKLRATEGQAAIDAIDVAAGLSLGEYTALAFAGALTWVLAG